MPDTTKSVRWLQRTVMHSQLQHEYPATFAEDSKMINRYEPQRLSVLRKDPSGPQHT